MKINLIFSHEQKALDQLRVNSIFASIAQEPFLKTLPVDDLEDIAKTNFIFIYRMPQVPFEYARRQLQEIMNTFSIKPTS